jgi:hypothetical protein
MARAASSVGENISHFTGVRIRVNGTGSLKLKMYTLDDIRNIDMGGLPMNPLTDIIPTRLCNLTTQRASLEIKTTEFGEVFKINRVIIYSREVASMYPG